ncbi:MAG: hypothetical protein Q8Q95_03420 [bacterium]|nr:hypothetical protein [bacterium]
MTIFKLQKNSEFLKAKSYKLKASSGYAAMFSFLVMMVVLGTLVSVFSILVLKGVFLARTSVIEFKNIYATEGAIEDTLKRVRDAAWADTGNGESLNIDDAVVTVSLTTESSVKDYLFSAQINNKYFSHGALRIDGAGPSAKIKRWQDTQ